MIPKKMQETLLFYMKLAKVHHGNSIDSFKNNRDMHDFITQEIQDTIKWIESQPTEEFKPKLKGHVPNSPPPEKEQEK